MPLDTSTYSLAHLRLDGRRWNDLRRIQGEISTQAAADGSAVFSMGNTRIIATVSGPHEQRRAGTGAQSDTARIEVEISVAGFSGIERKKRARSDKRIQEMQHTLSTTFSAVLLTHLYPHSSINLTLHVLSQDGSLLASCLNASTLALIDAGIPMRDYVAACTVGSTATYSENDEGADPLLDLNEGEERELPFLTLGTVGPESGEGDGNGEDKVVVAVMETRVQMTRLEGMVSVGLDGCRQVRGVLDGVVRAHGRKVLEGKVS